MVTGGAGFIGSHVVRQLLKTYPDYRVVNVDVLTYAGNLDNLDDVAGNPRYVFERADITDASAISRIMSQYAIDGIIHLAAESHVDRSIADPGAFVRTNVDGTMTLLEAARQAWAGNFEGKKFHHVSTDEVFGALPLERTDLKFTEQTPYSPHSPYSASKAGSDHLVRAYHDTYGLPTVITNCSNNYGPNQFPEKLIPLFISNIRQGLPLPVYGDGLNVRDWLYVEDHARAILAVFHRGAPGQTYCVGGNNEWSNICLVERLVEIADRVLGNPEGTSRRLITHITDRAGHDRRYAIDSSKIQRELGWHPQVDFAAGLELTVRWYLDNQRWLQRIASGEYRQ
jgi:dTDP-glucose 4,6-dehydratase